MEFSTFRSGAGAGEYRRVSADLRTGSGTLASFNVRIPILAGDRIGLRGITTATNCFFATGPGNSADVVFIGPANPPVGGPNETYTPSPQSRLNVAAVIEADGDGDGYGDETQDNCPSVANPTQTDTDNDNQGDACDSNTTTPDPPAPADTTAPETTIGSARIKSGSSKVKFGFASSEPGSTFQCRLTGKKVTKDALKKYAPCSSKQKYKGLKPGRYKFFVYATDPAGNADPTPAKQKFSIVDGL